MINKNLPSIVNNFPIEKKQEIVSNVGCAIQNFSEGAKNYSKSFKNYSQKALIQSTMELGKLIENCDLDENELKDILGNDYYKYKK